MKKNKGTFGDIDKIEVKDLVNQNYNEYYKDAFEKFDNNEMSIVFNKAALLAGPFWFLYRKMVFNGAIIVFIQVMLATVAYALKTPLWMSLYVLSYGLFVLSGMYGTKLYYKRVKGLVEQSKSIDKKYLGKFLDDKSGVDRYLTGCWIGGTIAIYYIALFF